MLVNKSSISQANACVMNELLIKMDKDELINNSSTPRHIYVGEYSTYVYICMVYMWLYAYVCMCIWLPTQFEPQNMCRSVMKIPIFISWPEDLVHLPGREICEKDNFISSFLEIKLRQKSIYAYG